MDHVRLHGVCASYGAHPVLRQVSLAVPRGGVLGLIGASGSGKSTVLRLLAGLLRPTEGEVSVAGETVDYANPRSVQTLRGRLAIVFQQYNLFQNMTVLRNVMIAPVKVQKRPRRQAETEAIALLEKVGLGGKLHAYPDQLSGGQQQRVAIARAQGRSRRPPCRHGRTDRQGGNRDRSAASASPSRSPVYRLMRLMKARDRASRGLVNSSAGGALSITRPASISATCVATSRTNAIS
jgi:predicted ABC-type transport system involved in lysophospholipase L1 biosynthesis ATPase subunit